MAALLRKTCLFALLLAIVIPVLPVHADDALDVLALVNAERARYCLAPLTYSDHLSSIAVRHSQDMVDRNYFAHIAPPPAPNGASPADRVTNGGYAWVLVGENLATGFFTPDAVVAAWMNSPGHRANILNPGYVEMGLARVGNTWTQLFGRAPGVPAPQPDCTLYGNGTAPVIQQPQTAPVDSSGRGTASANSGGRQKHK